MRRLKLLCDNLQVPVTALPGYIICTGDGGCELPKDITKEKILSVIEEVLSYGASSITVHSSFRKKHIEMLNNSERTASKR